MAASLDTRLNQMTDILKPETPVTVTNDVGITKPEPMPMKPNLVAPEDIVNAESITDAQPEPIQAGEQYASAKSVLQAVGKKAKSIVEKKLDTEKTLEKLNILPKEPTIVPVEGGYLVREADEKDVQNILGTIPNYNGKSLNLLRFGQTIGTDAATFFSQIKEANPQLIEDARRGTLNMESITAAAEDVGFGDLVKKFALRKPGDQLPLAEDMVAAIIGMKNIHLEIKILQDAASKSGSAEDAKKVLEAMAFAREFTKGVAGVSSEYGRGLGVIGNLAREQNVDLPTLAKDTDLAFRRLQATGDINYVGKMYGFLETSAQKTAFLKGDWFDKLKSGVGKTYDIIQEGYINALLSSPVTHMMNNFGNIAFGAYTNLENYAAAGVGYIRTLGGLRDVDRATFSQANAFMYGQIESFKDALRIAAASFIKDEPVTGGLTDKFNRKFALDAENLGINKDSYFGMGIDLLGTVQRMSGRLMMANDEFYKVINYRGALRQGAQIEADKAYFAAKQSGKTEDDAKIISQKVFSDFYSDPPKTLMDDAMDKAKTLTFQSELPEKLQKVEAFSNLPIIKFWMPFFRTNANMSIQTFDRLPVNPMTWKGLFTDDAAGDLARAKFGVASAAMGTFASIAYGSDKPDFFITGKPDRDQSIAERDARLGIQPYSFVFKNKDGSYESVSYARMEPVSALLAISADYALFARQADWSDKTTFEEAKDLATIGALSLYNYTSQLSFMQGMAELTSAFETYKQTDDRSAFDKVIERFSKGTTGAVITGVPTFGSFSATVERYVSPTKSETYVPSTVGETSDPIRDGFNQALDKAMSRNPFFSNKVVPDLNIWGEPIMQGRGSILETFNPIRIYQGKFKAVDQELRRLDIGLDSPSRFVMPGVSLNAEQYNRYIYLANSMDTGGRLPGDSGYEEEATMLPILEDTIRSSEYKSATAENQKSEIKANFRGFYKNAEIRLMQELAVNNSVFRKRLEQLMEDGSPSARRRAGRLLGTE